MAKTRPAKTQAERNRRQGYRCWPGYEPTPGVKPFEEQLAAWKPRLNI